MKTILCYGDSNTWGYAPNQNRRFDEQERWTGRLQASLAGPVKIVEEGLPGRTTVLDDPIEGEHKNGARYLLPCLESHHPDVVIVLLGTNDLKHRFNLSADDISRGAAKLVEIVRGFRHNMMPTAAEVVLVAPPPIKEIGYFAPMFEGGENKSNDFGKAFSARARELNCGFIDAGTIIHSCPSEGIHWQQDAHKVFAAYLSDFIKERFLS